MGLLDIFGGGGSDSTDALYAGLLTPEQLAAVKREQASKGLLAMAAAFGKAAMPSPHPVPLGAVLGQVAGAMGQADDTSAIGKFLAVQKLAAETATLKAKQAWIQQNAAANPNDPLWAAIDRAYGRGASGSAAPLPAGTPVDANGKPVAAFGTPARTSGGSADPGDPSTWPATTNIPPELAGDTLGGVPGLSDTLQSPLSPGGTLGARLALPTSVPARGAALRAPIPDVPFPTRVSGPAVPAPSWVGQPSSTIAALSRFSPVGGQMPPPRPGPFTPPGDTESYPFPTSVAGIVGRNTPAQFRSDLDVTDASGGGSPDVVVPSGPPRPGMPPVIRTQAQLTSPLGAPPAAPGAPPAAPGAPAAAGPYAGPQIPATPGGRITAPPPPPGDPAAQGAVLRELARRNTAAEMLGLGSPYSSLISILQNSPQSKAIEEYNRRNIGLGFAGPEAAAQAAARFPFEMTAEQYKSALKRYENQVQMLGQATLEPDPNGLRVSTGRPGEFVTLPVTKEQKARALNGFAVPEVGIPGINKDTGVDTRVTPGTPGTLPYGTPAAPVDRPPEEVEARKLAVAAGQKAIEESFAGEVAANRRAPLYDTANRALEAFKTGRTAEWRLLGGQLLYDVTGRDPNNVSDGEMLQNVFTRLQFEIRPAKGEGSVSNFERSLIAQVSPQLINTPAAIKQMLDIAQRLDDYDRKVAEIHRDVAGPTGIPNLIEAQRRISKLGPVLTSQQQAVLQGYATASTKAGAAAAPGGAPGGSVNTSRGTVTIQQD